MYLASPNSNTTETDFLYGSVYIPDDTADAEQFVPSTAQFLQPTNSIEPDLNDIDQYGPYRIIVAVTAVNILPNKPAWLVIGINVVWGPIV